MRTRLHDREVVIDGEVDGLFGHLQRDVVEQAVRANLHQKIAGLAVSEGPTYPFVMGRDQVIEQFGFVGDLHGFRHDVEQSAKIGFAGVGDFDLVRDTTQERIIDEVFGLQVGAEDDQLIEGDLEPFSALQRKVVVPLLERDHPSIQKFLDTHALPAKVIDQQDPAIAFELQGSFADVGVRVASDFEHRHRQFATSDNGWPQNANPSAIDVAFHQQTVAVSKRARLVVERIEQSHDFAIDQDGSRDPNVVSEGLGDPFRDARFAIARVAVQKHAATAVDRRSQAGQEAIGNEQVGKRALEVLSRWMLGFDRLQLDRLNVLIDRDRSRAVVGCLQVISTRTVSSRVGENMDVVVEVGRPAVDRQLLCLEPHQGRFDHTEGEFELVGDRSARHFASSEEQASRHILEDRFREPSFLKRGRLDRNHRFIQIPSAAKNVSDFLLGLRVGSFRDEGSIRVASGDWSGCRFGRWSRRA